MRWIWIDRFDEFHSGQSACAIKVVSVAEDHVHEQYPGYPIMPNSLIIEGLAQTGGILAGEATEFSEKVVLAKVPRVEFYDHAVPGDVLRYDVQLLEVRAEGAIVDAQVFKNDELMAKGEIVFAHLDNSRGIASELSAKNFVFTKDHLLALLRMARGSYHQPNGDGSSTVENRGQKLSPTESASPNGNG